MEVWKQYRQKFITNNSIDDMVNAFLNAFLAGLTAFCFAYALIYTLNFNYPIANILLAIFVVIILCSIIFLNKLTLITAGVISGIVACSWLAYQLFNKSLDERIDEIASFVTWNYDYITGLEDINKVYMNYTSLLLIIIMTVIAYIITVKRYNFILLLAGGTSIFVLQWMMDYAVSFLAFYIFVFLIILYYFKFIFIRKKRREPDNDYTAPVKFTLYVIPLAIAVFITSYYIPKADHPIIWDWLDRQVNRIYNYFNRNYNYISYDYFSFNSTGFGRDDGRLGGKVNIDNTPVLQVESSRRIYLRGACKDVYTGYSWKNSLDEINPLDANLEVSKYELLEPVLGFYLLSDNIDNFYTEYFLENSTVSISYLNLRTKTLFAPLGFNRIIFPWASQQISEIYVNSEDILASNKRMEKGFEYILDTYSLEYWSDGVKEILRKSYKGFYNDLLQKYERMSNSSYGIIGGNGNYLVIGTVRIDPKELNYDCLLELSDRAEKIYSRYTQLPENLPKRVIELANSITAGEENNYDKVKAIEKFLSSNYPYTLKPKATPRGRDFVDYFLFDLKEGYCTYYATAMAILVRSIGIPARYVEGYILPPKPIEQNIYEVTNQNAHAWVEVYFEGIGWVPFEPTAPFVSGFYNDRQAEGGAVLSESFYEDPFYLEYLEMLEMYDPSITSRLVSEVINEESQVQESNTKLFFTFTIIVLAVLLSQILVINSLRNKYLFKKIKKMPPKDAILALMKQYIHILSIQGLHVLPGETPSEYAERVSRYLISEKFGNNEKENIYGKRISKLDVLYKNTMFSKIMDIFIKARYSNAEITQNQKETVMAYYETLLVESKENLGIFKYFIYRYILGRI